MIEWIKTNKQLPQKGQKVWCLSLRKYSSSPWEYKEPFVAVYRQENKNKADSEFAFFFESDGEECHTWPDYWFPVNIPDPPPIEYPNKQNKCRHKWEEDEDSRFCPRCGKTQRAVITFEEGVR